MKSPNPPELTGKDLGLEPDAPPEMVRRRQAAASLVQRQLDEAKARAFGLTRKPTA